MLAVVPSKSINSSASSLAMDGTGPSQTLDVLEQVSIAKDCVDEDYEVSTANDCDDEGCEVTLTESSDNKNQGPTTAKECIDKDRKDGPELKSSKTKKSKKKRKQRATLADLLSPPPVTTFHDGIMGP